MQDEYDAPIALDPKSPAGSLLVELGKLRVDVAKPDGTEIAAECGHLFDALGAVDDQTDGDTPPASRPLLSHRGQHELTAAVASAGKRVAGEAWRWNRRGSGDVSALYAATLALWAWRTQLEHGYAETPGVWSV